MKKTIQKQANEKIQFEEATFDELLPISYKNQKHIGKELIHAFLQEDNSIIIWTLPEIENQLFELLNGNKLNEVAKWFITEKLKSQS